ncbi:MAG TPA: hypothetical protein VHS31_12350 [Tepidisphaeraceae bacterium]|nr:hypothetical protein [Tepidisphaeraceae bacterium]
MDKVHKLQRAAQKNISDIKEIVHEQIEHHSSEIDRLKEMLEGLGSAATGALKRGRKRMKAWMGSAPAKAGKKKKRIRRSLDDIKKDAKEVIAIIKSKGSQGAAARDFKKFKIIGSPKQWLKTYAPDAKIKVVGDKQKTRYFIA